MRPSETHSQVKSETVDTECCSIYCRPIFSHILSRAWWLNHSSLIHYRLSCSWDNDSIQHYYKFQPKSSVLFLQIRPNSLTTSVHFRTFVCCSVYCFSGNTLHTRSANSRSLNMLGNGQHCGKQWKTITLFCIEPSFSYTKQLQPRKRDSSEFKITINVSHCSHSLFFYHNSLVKHTFLCLLKDIAWLSLTTVLPAACLHLSLISMLLDDE